ncbi:hypothetical protein HDU86_002002 [Geranomyces michiganensis]|nr:hypothetical protein HDU86_002002 [Geranomyces michiganensis]
MILSPRLKNNARLPAVLSSVHGKEVNLAQLVLECVVIVVTLKAPWCPVCPTLLKVLSFLGLEQPTGTRHWTDPFTSSTRHVSAQNQRFNHLLLTRDAHFLILCPGSNEALADIACDIGWDNVPNASFVADVDWSLIDGLGLRMAAMGAWPAALRLRADLSVETIKIGRGPGFYGDHELMAALAMIRNEEELRALSALKQSRIMRKKLQLACLAATRYDHPARDRLPIELLRAIMEAVARDDLATCFSTTAAESPVRPPALIPNSSTFCAAALVCKSWRYVALSTALEILQAQTASMESMLAHDSASGHPTFSRGDSDEKSLPTSPVLRLRTEVNQLICIKWWLHNIFGNVSDLNPAVQQPRGSGTRSVNDAEVALCAS